MFASRQFPLLFVCFNLKTNKQTNKIIFALEDKQQNTRSCDRKVTGNQNHSSDTDLFSWSPRGRANSVGLKRLMELLVPACSWVRT